MSFQFLLSLEINCDYFIYDHFAQGYRHTSVSQYFSPPATLSMVCKAQYLSILRSVSQYLFPSGEAQYLSISVCVWEAQYLSIFLPLTKLSISVPFSVWEAQYLSISVSFFLLGSSVSQYLSIFLCLGSSISQYLSIFLPLAKLSISVSQYLCPSAKLSISVSVWSSFWPELSISQKSSVSQYLRWPRKLSISDKKLSISVSLTANRLITTAS